MYNLNSRTVFITGASSGIGASCATAFAAAGCRLLLCARRLDRLEALAETLREKFGAEVLLRQLDVRDRQAVDATIAALPPSWQDIDILLNNAGLARGFDKLHEASVEDWEEMLDTNVKGLLYVTRRIVPGMVERGRGQVINIGSIAGQEAYPKGGVYNASKFAVDAITKSLRMDLVDTPVRVSTVDPGLVETEFSLVRFHGDEQKAGAVYDGITVCTPDDVAEAVLFCATRPPHVSINQVVLMPTAQASAMVRHTGQLK